MLRFDKYHGIGNDFLVVPTDDPERLSVERAMAICRRHFGVGADGVLLVSPPESSGARAKMTVINADGSRPEMCGNGLRCVALHLASQAKETEVSFVVDTDAGPLRCDVEADGRRGLVGTEIGQGISVGTIREQWADTELEFSRVETGNPHAICFREPLSDDDLDELGPRVSSRIEGGANVEIATLRGPTEMDVKVWERGVGRTLACGTGAAATVIAATAQGLTEPNRTVLVNLPGGPLELRVSEDHRAYLRGPAEWVYRGELEH